MTPLLTTAYCDILLPPPPADWLYVDWKGPQTRESVLDGCEQMLTYLRTLRYAKVLNDNTNVVGGWSDASRWVAGNWFPRMAAAGLRQFAWVQSKSEASRRSANESAMFAGRDRIIWLFDDRESAEVWLALHDA